jgi:toxin ParE1/3/4
VRVDFHPIAIRELLEAAAWYKKRSLQAAKWFSEEIDHSIEKIKATPDRFARVGKSHQACTVERFPYQIIYRLDLERIYIVSIAHSKRRPNYWRRRK